VSEIINNIEPMEEIHKENESKRSISRRDFLKIVGAASASIATGAEVGRIIGETGRDYLKLGSPDEFVGSIEQLPERIEVARNMEKQLVEIGKYREKLGLTQLPWELSLIEKYYASAFISEETWREPAEIALEMPVAKRSYGELIKDVMKKVYGDKSGRLVKAVYSDEGNPEGVLFWNDTRKVSLPREITNKLYPDVLHNALHEAVGHGSDPADALTVFPTGVLLKAEEGKWRALSKALSIEGQFLFNPGDSAYPMFKKDLGEAYAREFVLEKQVPAFGEGMNDLTGPLAEIAQKQGVAAADIKFNKRACLVIGTKLTESKLSKRISFNDNLEKAYNEKMDSALREIYAEMVKYALIYPDLINNDEDIVGGVKEVFQAISGRDDIDMNRLRAEVIKPNPELLVLRSEEEKAVAAAVSIMEQESLSQPPQPVEYVSSVVDVAEIKEEITDISEKRDKFESFIQFGELPESAQELSDEERGLFETYAKQCSKMISEYPTLSNTLYKKLDWEFDPPLHIWEIMEIEMAIDTAQIRELLDDPSLLKDSERFQALNSKSEVLQKFIDSEAFGVRIS